MHLIGLVLFAMALGMGALFLLAKAQKENLGKLYSVSAYVVLTISVLVILFSITAGIMHCCHKKHCGKEGACGKGKIENCGGKDMKCKSMKSCRADASCGASMSAGYCSSGEMKCGKGGNCMMMNPHGKMFKKKIVKKIGSGDSVDVDVKIITE